MKNSISVFSLALGVFLGNAANAYVPADQIIICSLRASEIDRSNSSQDILGEVLMGMQLDLRGNTISLKKDGIYELSTSIFLPNDLSLKAHAHFATAAKYRSSPFDEKYAQNNSADIRFDNESKMTIHLRGKIDRLTDPNANANIDLTMSIQMKDLQKVLTANQPMRAESPAVFSYENNSFVGDVKIPNVSYDLKSCRISRYPFEK